MTKYTRTLLLTVVLLTASIVSAAWYVDAFTIWRPDAREALAQGRYPRLTRAHWIRGFEATGLIIGNSHPGAGFSAQSFDRHFPGLRFFNGTFQGGQIYEMRRYAEHYVAIHRPRVMLVFVDIFNFFDDQKHNGDFDETRLSTYPDGSPNPRWWSRDLMPTIFSWSAVGRTVASTISPDRGESTRGGFLLCSPQAAGGTLARIRESVQEHYRDRLATERGFMGRRRDIGWRANLEALIDLGQKHADRVILAIPPLHASFYAALHATGYLEPSIDLMRVAAELSRGRHKVEVWDFTGINPYTAERPTGSARAAFWSDSDHFTCRLGDMIAATFAGTATEPFGVRLRPENVTAHMNETRAAFKAWLEGPDAAEYRDWLGGPGQKVSAAP